jgi:NitT/TauT family transport system substrate-binding protein
MVTNDGGNGKSIQLEKSEGKLSMFEAVKEGRIDATWIFLPWEGVEAETEGVETKVFKLADYGVPYGFSPVIARNAGSSPSEDVLAAFGAATREGYQHAIDHPDDAAEVLGDVVTPARSKDFLSRSQASINEYYSDGNKLGFMDPAKWSDFVSWLRKQDLLQGPNDIKDVDIFTNEFAQ